MSNVTWCFLNRFQMRQRRSKTFFFSEAYTFSTSKTIFSNPTIWDSFGFATPLVIIMVAKAAKMGRIDQKNRLLDKYPDIKY